jgi:transcriptional regulator with XRE-family HTH domain
LNVDVPADRDTPGDLARADDLVALVGARVRAARLRRGMTLADLAAASGVSVSGLSRLESGERQPSLAAVLNVAAGLGVGLDELLDGRQPQLPRQVLRRADAVVREAHGMRFASLVPDAAPGGLTVVRVTLPTGADGGAHPGHDGEEWLYVLAGQVHLELGEDSWILEPGDAAWFDARQRHLIRPVGGARAELLLVAAARPSRNTERVRPPHFASPMSLKPAQHQQRGS